MKTVKEVSRMTGVSVRTLQYYDRIGLLRPAAYSPAGYRLYDGSSLAQLSQILLYRELEFSLAEIREILSVPGFDRSRALTQQIELLKMRREHLDGLIRFAQNMQQTGGKNMDFSAFDRSKLDEYAARAKAEWGHTPQYAEMCEKQQNQTPEDEQAVIRDFMEVFAEFGRLRGLAPDSAPAAALVQRLQDFITAHYYRCTDEILRGLGRLYAAGGEFTENIDAAGGAGTAAFAAAAIEAHCARK